MSDIVERLRAIGDYFDQAAIKRLRQQVHELQSELGGFMVVFLKRLKWHH